MTTNQKAAPQAATKDTPAQESAAGHAPIVVDLGKKSRKAIRKLRKGQAGKLMDHVQEALEHLRTNGALAENAQPIIIVVKQKPQRSGKRMAKMWGLG